MESNPYTPPSANLFGSTAGTSGDGVPEGAITQLQRTKPWVRFIGVLMWIAVGLMLLGGIGIAVMGAIGVGAIAQGQGAGSGGMIIGMAVVYALMALLYVYPTIKIWKYGSSIGRLAVSRSADDLVSALDQQRSFWKFVGVLMIVTLVIYLVVIIGAAVVGATAGFGNMPVPGAGD